MLRTALITGITGQDGSYLTELLLDKGYEVHGLIRRSSSFNTGRIQHLYQDPHILGGHLHLHYGDMTDASSLLRLVKDIKPDELYHLAAQSHVAVSFELPEYTADVDALGTLRILDAIRTVDPSIRFYQAGTSELYGQAVGVPQSETTPFNPRSPYAAAKLYAHAITVNYRDAYGIHASNGILFNHESPRRGKTFVTRKITRAVSRIKHGLDECLYLGNLDAQRDWGYAPEYVEAMWRMMQQDSPGDYVVATGVTHSVREFAELAFACADMPVEWHGEGIDTIGRIIGTDRVVVRIDPSYFRPTEVDLLLGDSTKAREVLGWSARTTLEELVAIMVNADLAKASAMSQLLKLGIEVNDEGFD